MYSWEEATFQVSRINLNYGCHSASLLRVDDAVMGFFRHEVLVRTEDSVHRNCSTEVFQPVQTIKTIIKIDVRLGFLLPSAFTGNAFFSIRICSTGQISQPMVLLNVSGTSIVFREWNDQNSRLEDEAHEGPIVPRGFV